MDVFDYNSIATCGTSLENVLETINGKLYAGQSEWFNSSGKVVVAASKAAGLDEYIERNDIVIVGDHEDCQIKSLELGANCLIVTCDHKPGKEVISLAEKNNAVVVVTELDTYTVVRLINQSIPVGSIMCKNDESSRIVKFYADDFVENIKELMVKNRYRSYPVLYNDGRVAGFISRFHLISQRKKKVILLDHNEKSQTAPGIEEAEVLEIIDHHKIGDLTTSAPILFKNEPVGSTSTIIANMYIDMGRRPSVSIAGILCAAIISDTLKFESPTATDYDRRTAEKLAAIAGINIDEFAGRMFTAGSSLKDKTPKEMYSQDFKRVSFNDYHMGISQITILNMDHIAEEKQDIIEYMSSAAYSDHFDLLALMITELSTKKTELCFIKSLPLTDTNAFPPTELSICL
jgi:manganese-dependent inorganic pyrophosphatase